MATKFRRPPNPKPLTFLVLCLLAEASMHPYEMKRLLRERGKDQLPGVNADSLYHSIDQLVRAGLIEAAETTREGGRPERTVYRVTEAGRDTVYAWARELLIQPTHEFPKAILPLAHAALFTPDELRVLLARRALLLEGELAGTDAMVAAVVSGEFPRVFLLEAEYARALQAAELEWVKSVVADLAAGRLDWDLAELEARFSTHPPEVEVEVEVEEAGGME